MEGDRIGQVIEQISRCRSPVIQFIKRPTLPARAGRLGVFAASFNPPTMAHLELMRRAEAAHALDGVLALATYTNADKSSYEVSLEDRLRMLALAFAQSPSVSVGISSHAYFVDMVDAVGREYPAGTDLLFILGFDTFERVLDREGKYTGRYHKKFKDRREPLDYLLARGRLVVAARAGAGRDEIDALLVGEPARMAERVLFLDFPVDLGERSATEVRLRARAGLSVSGLVPRSVEHYMQERKLYSADSPSD